TGGEGGGGGVADIEGRQMLGGREIGRAVRGQREVSAGVGIEGERSGGDGQMRASAVALGAADLKRARTTFHELRIVCRAHRSRDVQRSAGAFQLAAAESERQTERPTPAGDLATR